MVELAVWYDQDARTAVGATPLVARTPEELDTVIDRVRAETIDHACGAAVQIGIAGREGWPVLEVGLGQNTGFITYHAPDGGTTLGDGDPEKTVEYAYMGTVSEIPADIEVPLEQVRRGLHEFLATGTRPTVVHP